ncbi:VWA domain-containing protein [Streptomyces coffeae]|uniref:VWA domain-containing protein n=1 Tax=Streptomyces coffeae TaxID=621382 RepID=A0ABS1NHF4_9ACTN|nr:VWA domain-containing protein [Streptomyces coffeae]MBL1099451.1 VWA domain-containing protein [Streptomyces coffeae]
MNEQAERTAAPARDAAISLRVHQNKYLPAAAGPTEMHAVIVVEAQGLGPAAARTTASQVIVIDCSGSMSWPHTKIAAARRATATAVQLLRDGTRFAIVQGTERADVVYPPGGGMAVASADTRAAAARAAAVLPAVGGTAIGSWLDLARRLHLERPAAIRHTLLLTDGRNEHDPPGYLHQVLGDCAPHFICDARGIGDGWDATELREIVRRLHGRADAVLEDSALTAAFEEMVSASMAKALAGVRIRVRSRAGGRIGFVKQLHPTRVDLTAEGTRPDARTWECRTDAWGDEVREFHVCVLADPGGDPAGEDVELAVVELALDGDTGPAPPEPRSVLVQWTDDVLLSSRVDPRLLHYGADADLGRAITAGCDAYEAGEREEARRQWALAVRLAHQLGSGKTLSRLRGLVDIVDAATGTVRIRETVRPLDLNSVLIVSDESVRFTGAERAGAAPAGPDVDCPGCGRTAPASAAFCQQCDAPLRPGEPGGAP